MLCLCAAQLKVWFQTDLGRENSASYLRQGRQLLLTLLTIVMCWSRSRSNFYALIGQNWTGEFMPKIYVASRILFTLTVEAYRVLCQLLMFLTALSTGCTKWNSAVIHGKCVYWVFGWEIRHLSKLEIRFRMAWFSFYALLDAYMSEEGWKSEATLLALLDTFQGLHLEW